MQQLYTETAAILPDSPIQETPQHQPKDFCSPPILPHLQMAKLIAYHAFITQFVCFL